MQMLLKGMRDKPIEISQGSLGSLRVAVPYPSPKVGEGESTATLEVGDQVIGYTWLINSTFQKNLQTFRS